MAVEMLTTEEQTYFNAISHNLLVQMPYLDKRENIFKGASATALISLFPERHNQASLKKLYKDYGVVIPPALEDDKSKNTVTWHFMTRPIKSTCQYKQANISTYLKKTIKAYHQSVTLKDKAIMLAFIQHLVVDIHSPLHTYSLFNSRCSHDFNAYKFCLSRDKEKPQQCKRNLHELWDGALRWIKNDSLDVHIRQLNQKVDKKKNYKKPISGWVDESLMIARFAYKTPRNKIPSKAYFIEGQTMMKQRMVDASTRLSMVLKSLYQAR
jgi:hypothetical protein